MEEPVGLLHELQVALGLICSIATTATLTFLFWSADASWYLFEQSGVLIGVVWPELGSPETLFIQVGVACAVHVVLFALCTALVYSSGSWVFKALQKLKKSFFKQ